MAIYGYEVTYPEWEDLTHFMYSKGAEYVSFRRDDDIRSFGTKYVGRLRKVTKRQLREMKCRPLPV
jgi:hypothetical protein